MTVRLKAHKIYLFSLKNGKKKLAYGDDVDHALRVLSYRLSEREMAEILNDPPPLQIRQDELQRHAKELG